MNYSFLPLQSCSHFPGIFALIWYAAWEYFSYDSPASHPTISKAERFYIENSIGGNAFDPLASIRLNLANKSNRVLLFNSLDNTSL